MSPKRPQQSQNLFAAAGMEQDAPHPLPDRLRPKKLSEVVGQDQILGPDADPPSAVPGLVEQALKCRFLEGLACREMGDLPRASALLHKAELTGERLAFAIRGVTRAAR